MFESKNMINFANTELIANGEGRNFIKMNASDYAI